jgi:hypothetical protein
MAAGLAHPRSEHVHADAETAGQQEEYQRTSEAREQAPHPHASA